MTPKPLAIVSSEARHYKANFFPFFYFWDNFPRFQCRPHISNKMIIVRALLIALFSIHFAFSNRILLDVKKLIRGKVLASGFSVSTKSLPHCIEYCNRRKKTCDGIVFHEAIQKCRLVNKCSPVHQVDNSSSIVYYSRRPQSKLRNYFKYYNAFEQRQFKWKKYDDGKLKKKKKKQGGMKKNQ